MTLVPEGPTIVLLREEVSRFAGRKIIRADGNAKIDMSQLAGQKVTSFRSWGKHFLIELPEVAVRVHFLMFGSYAVDAHKDREPRLGLRFRGGEVNFYSCSVRLLEGRLDEIYDWTGDVMSGTWDADAARAKLRNMTSGFVCDALLDQNVFAGVGNIIKNEVLFRVGVHPLSTIGALPVTKLHAIVEQARQYSFEFLEWRRASVLRKHLLVHNKGICPSCNGKLSRAYLGTTDRRSFFCERCQKRFGPKRKPANAQRPSKKIMRKRS